MGSGLGLALVARCLLRTWSGSVQGAPGRGRRGRPCQPWKWRLPLLKAEKVLMGLVILWHAGTGAADSGAPWAVAAGRAGLSMRSCRQGQALAASTGWGVLRCVARREPGEGGLPLPLPPPRPVPRMGRLLRASACEWGLSAGSLPRAALTHSDRYALWAKFRLQRGSRP